MLQLEPEAEETQNNKERAGDRRREGRRNQGGRRNAKDKEERGLTGGQSVASQEGRVGGRVGGAVRD